MSREISNRWNSLDAVKFTITYVLRANEWGGEGIGFVAK